MTDEEFLQGRYDAERAVLDAARLVVAFSHNGAAGVPNSLHREQGCCMHCAITRLSNALITLDQVHSAKGRASHD